MRYKNSGSVNRRRICQKQASFSLQLDTFYIVLVYMPISWMFFFFIVQIKRKPNRTIFEKSSPHGPHGVCRTRRNKFDEEKKIGYYELNYFKCYIFLCYVRSLNVCRAQRVLMRKDNETRTAIIKKKRTNNLFMVSVRFIYKWLCDRMCDSQRKIICILFQLNGTREKLYKTN